MWDFGDGGSASGPAPSHVYADQGAYIVTLTVSDGLAFATDTLVITVSNGAPAATVSGPAGGVRGQERTFSFAADDPSPIDQAASFTYAIDWGDGESQIVSGPDSIQAAHTFANTGSTTWSNFTPKVGVSWKASPDVLLYASWTKGFRSGGYNIRTTGANELAGPYDQEVVKALEGGIKTELLDGKARVNLAVFHNKFDGLQRTVNSGLVNFIANVALSISGPSWTKDRMP